MGQNYSLLVMDMDGTLLRSDKTISNKVLKAIEEAVSSGKIAALGTGRPVAELAPYREILKSFRYAILESGSLLYDLQEDAVLYARTLREEEIPEILRAISMEDVMPQAMRRGNSYVNQADIARMDHYQMGIYQSLYEQTATGVADIRTFMEDHAGELEKINLYHTSASSRERTKKRLSGITAEKTFAEQSSLEISPPGSNKGTGLIKLCEILGISVQSAIAVGDADNDIPMIRMAGLGVAVGNAAAHVQSAADVVVSDNDHDGCLEVIRRFLL